MDVRLVYSQVVALAVCIYFAVAIFGHHFIDAFSILPLMSTIVNSSKLTSVNNNNYSSSLNNPANDTHVINGISFPRVLTDIPVFTILFTFYSGWLKVAESLVSPLGFDDGNTELITLLGRNLNTSQYFEETSTLRSVYAAFLWIHLSVYQYPMYSYYFSGIFRRATIQLELVSNGVMLILMGE